MTERKQAAAALATLQAAAAGPDRPARVVGPLPSQTLTMPATVALAIWEALRELCGDCSTPAQAGTRNGYTCPVHVSLLVAVPGLAYALEAERERLATILPAAP